MAARYAALMNEEQEKYEQYDDETIAVVRWKEPAGTVLDIIDQQLEAFGLEVVQYDTHGDDYMWRIEKRAA